MYSAINNPVSVLLFRYSDKESAVYHHEILNIAISNVCSIFTQRSDMTQKPLTETEENTRTFLLNLPVFNSFDDDEITLLARHMSYVQLNKGEFLFVEGDKGTFMGFVLRGLLEVFKTTETGESVIIARLTKGSPIGEMALIDKSPRSASVLAAQPTTLITLTDKGFDLLMEKSPALGVKVIQKIARLLSLNMRRTSSRLADLLQTHK